MTDPAQTQLVEPQKQLSKPRRKHVLNPVNRGVPWSDVLRGIPRSETRSQVLDHYRRREWLIDGPSTFPRRGKPRNFLNPLTFGVFLRNVAPLGPDLS